MAGTTLSNADVLLSAMASSTSSSGPVLSATLAETTPVTPVPGGAIATLNTASPTNTVTIDSTPKPGAFDATPLLWVGAGIGTAWLLSRSDRTVSGKKPKWLVPALILGAGAAWYFFGDKIAAATSNASGGAVNTSGGANMSATDAQRQALQQWGAGNAKELAVINSADAATIDIWARLVGMWNNSASTAQLYSTYPDGTAGATWDKSIGKWWENFSAANHF